MSVHRVAATRITGLAASGTTDDLGSWNEDVDLDSFVTVPSGATAVILTLVNDSSSSRFMGVRTPAKTTAVYHLDQTGDTQREFFVPLGAGNTIDIYCEEVATSYFVILGFTSDAWTFFDIDATLPVMPTTGGTLQTITAPAEIPSGVETILMHGFDNADWMPVGESTLLVGGAITAPALLKLDGSKQVQADWNGTLLLRLA